MRKSKTDISPFDRAKLRVESGCAERTIKNYPNVREASKRRIEQAAKRLNIELPAE